MRIALLNLSSAANHDMALIADALKIGLVHVCAAWERAPIDVQFMPSTSVAPRGWVPLVAFEQPDQAGAGAEGYHDVDEVGRPYGRAFRSVIPGGTVLHDPNKTGASLAAVLAHEAVEMALDILANAYQDGPFRDPATGKSYQQVAVELADPVQELAYQITVEGQLVDFTDFIYPEWFSRHAQITDGAQFDHMRALTAPLTLAPGGYVIVREAARDRQIFARLFRGKNHPTNKGIAKVTDYKAPAEWREKMKLFHGGRTRRRLGG